ncbi:MAG: hypothetical protein VCA38_17560 [Roseibacillus sp.]
MDSCTKQLLPGEAGAARKRGAANDCNAVRDGDGGEAPAAGERVCADLGDRLAVDHGGDFYIANRVFVVVGDRNGLSNHLVGEQAELLG